MTRGPIGRCGLCAEPLPCPCLGKLLAEQCHGQLSIRERNLRTLQAEKAEATRRAEASRQLRRTVRKCMPRETRELWERAIEARKAGTG
jgi:hypothetical protein